MILILLALLLVIITLAILLTVFIVWWKREKDWALTWHNSYTYTYSQYLQLVRVGETAQLRCSKCGKYNGNFADYIRNNEEHIVLLGEPRKKIDLFVCDKCKDKEANSAKKTE